MSPPRWSLETPGTGLGAISVFRLSASASEGDLDGWLAAHGLGGVAEGGFGVRSLFGVDEGVVARFSALEAWLMPHGGPAVLRALARALDGVGAEREVRSDPRSRYPEARSPFEAFLLDALARAASPRAIDLLLDQPRRWGKLAPDPALDEMGVDERERALARLIEPPLVVVEGEANIGKSTLLNALAGSAVALTADAPGTTRDHVGALLTLDGLTVRWVDTPGLREGGGVGPEEGEAARISRTLRGSGDLVLLCGDPTHAPPPAAGAEDAMRVLLRSDLGDAGTVWGEVEAEVSVSARTGAGLSGLATAVREHLLPTRWLEDGRAWRFWRGPGRG